MSPEMIVTTVPISVAHANRRIRREERLAASAFTRPKGYWRDMGPVPELDTTRRMGVTRGGLMKKLLLLLVLVGIGVAIARAVQIETDAQ